MQIAILAVGALGAHGEAMPRVLNDAGPRLTADAPPVPLRDLGRSLGIEMPRLASRFAELAVIGARLCLQRAPAPPPAATRVYLGTGLGDVARTDALYYEVMPPKSELPSPAYFATAGNNIAGFFVAQQAGLVSRNLTVSAGELSFERALDLALSDLAAGACTHALVGAVDETTTPREFYVRRFPLAENKIFGEGSAWVLLTTEMAAGAIGTIECLRIDAPHPVDHDQPAWAAEVSSCANRYGVETILPGCGIDAAARLQLAVQTVPTLTEYLPATGYFPTAIGLGLVAWIDAVAKPTTALLLNRDGAGRTGYLVVSRT